MSLEKKLEKLTLKILKKYLDNSKFTYKSTVWKSNGSNEGYYGIEIVGDKNMPTYVSGVSKRIYKKRVDDDEIIETWKSVADAAYSQDMSISNMSRIARSETVIDNYYYSLNEA